ncbi:MAG: MBL fold metallo-hydrolase [Synergistaceae bacterium]|nr:MBL fold metallo-hydrolase [Synergistaceae bacterium]
MRKIFAALLAVMVLSGSAFANGVSVGNMSVTNFDGGVKLHAYGTGDNMNDYCYVVESPEGLVLVESTAYRENVKAFAEYIASLGKPLAGALFSYHPNGYKSYGDVKIYATDTALKSWAEGGSVWNLTQSFIKAAGDKVAEDLPVKTEIIKEGDTVKLAGMDFVILHESDGEGYGIYIPAINTVYRHMMGSKTHNILPAIPYIEAEISELKGYKDKGYSLILTSHNAPEGKEAVDEKIAYLEKVLKTAKTSKNRAEFISAVKEAFPGYSGEAYLEMSAGALFSE